MFVIARNSGEQKEAYVMPNLLYFLQWMRQWRIDADEHLPVTVNPSTPIINVLPCVDEPKKKNDEKLEIMPEVQQNGFTNAYVRILL